MTKMECDIIKDLIPLYIDGCCSEKSASAVEEHLSKCEECRHIYENMKDDSAVKTSVPAATDSFVRINNWKASVIQSLLLLLSFALITVGVSLEAATPSGPANGIWAFSLVVPSTGFLISLANWYFIRMYKTKKSFSVCSVVFTFFVSVVSAAWTACHYSVTVDSLADFFLKFGMCIISTALFCVLSGLLSAVYANLMGML